MMISFDEPALLASARHGATAEPGPAVMEARWREFLRGLADEVDTVLGATQRDAILRGVGRRMAQLAPLPRVAALDALEIEMNEALTACGWGRVQLRLDEGDRCLLITHHGLPRIGSAGFPHGQWLAAVLEGLYEAWLARQPGAEPFLEARRLAAAADAVVLRYARATM